MADKDITKITEEDTIETFEFTDDDGQEHCFVVESRFKAGNDDYVALLEVDPAIFDEGEEECGHEHAAYGHAVSCGYGHDHDAEETEEEELNIILAKIVTDENGEVDIQVPSDAEFEKAKIAYEALEA